MSQSTLFEVPFGKKPGQVNIKQRSGYPVNLPDQIYMQSDLVFVPNLHKRRLKVFQDDGRLKMLIGGNIKKEAAAYKIIHFPLSQPVRAIGGPDDTFYVQNRVVPENLETPADGSGTELSPMAPFSSYILQFNENGELKSTLGQQGLNSAPFGYIRRMDVDSKEQLAVLHIFGLELVLAYFDPAGKLLREISESKLPLQETEEDKTFQPETENIIPYYDGEHFLVSVAYRDKTDKDEIRYRLKYRKILRCRVENPSSCETMLEISDPRESLFWTTSDGGFYIWQSEDAGNSVRLQVYDQEGTHVNNKLIELEGPRSNWRQLYADLEGNILSVYADGKNFTLTSWE